MQKKINRKEFIELRKEGKTLKEIAEEFNVSERTALRMNSDVKEELTIEELELIESNVQLAKQKQKLQDQQRIERKSFREQTRLENAVAELQKELITLIKEKSFPKSTFRKKKIERNTKVGAVVHLSDLHFNELINLMFNKYDFKVASKRLKKFVDDTKKYLNANNVKDICICMTGDILNSDRRLDELLSEATNRAKALMLSVYLLEQVFIDFQKDYNVSVASVIGNESRITKDVGWVEEVASDNYDYIVHQMLTMLFRNSDIKFFQGHSTEKVVEIVGQNILLVHGNQMKSTNMEKEVQRLKGKWNSQNVRVDFMLCGHYHSCRIGDVFARSSSLAGANAYSNDALQLESRASQNIHIFFDNGNRDSIKIDLQNVDDIEGYKIDSELESYNAKSVEKSKKKVTIHKIVV